MCIRVYKMFNSKTIFCHNNLKGGSTNIFFGNQEFTLTKSSGRAINLANCCNFASISLPDILDFNISENID